MVNVWAVQDKSQRSRSYCCSDESLHGAGRIPRENIWCDLLVGDEQVKIIQREIEQEIDAKEIVSRNILCGNSANFQGDERDVVFLSLVDSGDGTGPLSMMGFGVDDAMRKRYNVAASRARDQLLGSTFT